MKPVFNKIFVKIDKKFQDEVETESGIKFYKDPTFNPEDNSTNFGIVAFIPETVDKVNVEEDFIHNVQVGDKLYFNYNVVMDPDNCLVHDGEEYWMVDYWNAIALVRDGKVEPVGSYILIDPIKEEEVKSSIIHIPDAYKAKEKTRGIVWSSNSPEIPVGSDVEYEKIGKFWNIIEGKRVYCMMNNNVMFIYEKENSQTNKIDS